MKLCCFYTKAISNTCCLIYSINKISVNLEIFNINLTKNILLSLIRLDLWWSQETFHGSTFLLWTCIIKMRSLKACWVPNEKKFLLLLPPVWGLFQFRWTTYVRSRNSPNYYKHDLLTSSWVNEHSLSELWYGTTSSPHTTKFLMMTNIPLHTIFPPEPHQRCDRFQSALSPEPRTAPPNAGGSRH